MPKPGTTAHTATNNAQQMAGEHPNEALACRSRGVGRFRGHLPAKLGLHSLALTITLHGRGGTLKALAKTSSHAQEVTRKQHSLPSTTTKHLPQLTFTTLNLPPGTCWQGDNWALYRHTSTSPFPFIDSAQLVKKQRGSMFVNSPLTPAGASAASTT